MLRRFCKGDMGLVRFKQMFAPQWQQLYLVAPSRIGIVIAGLEVARAIHRPAPLRKSLPPQDHLEQNEFARHTQAWHTGA
jgi:phosphatidylglycerol lysyltransferase